MQLPPRPRCPGDRRAPHQHLAIRTQLYLAPGHRFSKGPPGHVERVVQRDQRRCLRHPVALYQHKTQRIPELLQRLGNAPPPEISAQNLSPKSR
jgi:hypothetical protein